MVKTPTFSIVTPSFKQLDLLSGCIYSVAAEAAEGCAVEHIVQDAGTAEIESLAAIRGAEFYRDGILVTPSAKTHPLHTKPPGYSLKIFSESDHGMYDAINKGLLKSQGRFCAWLNCDERYTEGALRKVARQFEKKRSADAVFGDMIVIDDRNKPLSYRRGIVQDHRLLVFSALNISSCTLFFRRELVERGLLLDPAWKVIGDKEWVARLIHAGIGFQQLREPLACFRLLPDSLSASPQAAAEQAKFAHLHSAPSFAKRLALTLIQVARKSIAGCYWPRHVDLRVTESSGYPARIGPAWVGFRWPASALKPTATKDRPTGDNRPVF